MLDTRGKRAYHGGMTTTETRYLVLATLIRIGQPATPGEVENFLAVGDGTTIDARPILRDLEADSLVTMTADYRWEVAR